LKTFLTQFDSPYPLRRTHLSGCVMTKRRNDHRNCNLGSVSAKNELLFSPTPHLPTLYTRRANQVRIGKKTSLCLRTPARKPLPRWPAEIFPKISDFSRLLGAFVSLSQNREDVYFWGSMGHVAKVR
jgi:hypothetical protein